MYTTAKRLMALLLAISLIAAVGCKDKDKDEIVLEQPTDAALPAPTAAPSPAIELAPAATPAVQPAQAQSFPTPDGIPDPGEEKAPEKMSFDADHSRYKKLNPDVVGWISVPNTRIEYPVMLGGDNEFYLHHTPEKKYSKSGSVFMDYRNADEGRRRHVIIYGHNMRNGTMFHDLTSYKVKDFFENADTITLYWGEEPQVYDVYAAFIVTADINFTRTQFKNDDDFLTYMNELRALSKFRPKQEVELTADSEVLTLSTCTYEYDNSRYVVQAVKR